MADLFSYNPSTNYSRTSKPRVRTVSFGGGYSQRVPESFNNIDKSWSLTFDNRPNVDADALLQFLEDKRGAEAFVFIPPDETGSGHLVICKEWNATITSPFTKSISCTFEKVYE